MKIKKNNDESTHNTTAEQFTVRELARAPRKSTHISILIFAVDAEFMRSWD